MIALTPVLTIPEVARRAGWSRQRMWKYLVREHARHGGGLLHNMSMGTQRPRWTVSEGALKALMPQWFADPEAVHMQLEACAENASRHDDELAALRAELMALRGMVTTLAQNLGTRAESQRRAA